MNINSWLKKLKMYFKKYNFMVALHNINVLEYLSMKNKCLCKAYKRGEADE